MGAVRFRSYDPTTRPRWRHCQDHERDDFDSPWAEAPPCPPKKPIAYAQRGRGQRRRPTSGSASLTPTERDVIRLVCERAGQNDIATAVRYPNR